MTPAGSHRSRWGAIRLGVAVAVGAALVLLLPSAERSDKTAIPPSTTTTTTTTVAAASVATTAATTTSTSTSVPPIEAEIPLTAAAVVDKVAPSVGFVLTQQGTGSGVVISDELLVTNAHVVWPDRTVSLVFLNGATHQGRVLAIDPFVDLAVVDISPLTRKPAPVQLGTTENVGVGDPLWIVGYPLPSEFTPEPTVDAGDVTSLTNWEFSGVRWFTVSAPAIGGQSGGAVVDSVGRLVGISTFGSTASLTSISVDDVLSRVDDMLAASSVRGLEPRLIPHDGARRTQDVALDGVWDQQLFVGWLPANADVTVAAAGSGMNLSARTIDGVELAQGRESVEFRPGFVFPVIVAAEAARAAAAQLDGSLPLIALDDPDHGQVLSLPGSVAGVFDVGRDRDFFYLELGEGEKATVTVESAARTHLWVYGPDGEVVAEDSDESGFIDSSASVEVETRVAGRYVVALESRLSSVSGYSVVSR